MADDSWTNHGYEIYKDETGRDPNNPQQGSAYFTSGAIRKASLQWYKMKWQFTASVNDLWGEEVQGYAEMTNDSPLANLPLFSSGKVIPIRIRFFNMIGGDDAANDIRCSFLKFGDSQEDGPFDLAFTTGRVACFDSVSALQTFLTALDGDEDNVRDWTLLQPHNYYSLVDALRRFPNCWSSLDYHNHATFSVDTNGSRKLIRFRLHGDNDTESRLSREEQEVAWNIRRPDIELPSDTYLHDNMQKVTVNNLRTKLQVQIRHYDVTDQAVLFPTESWDEAKFQWQDVADIVMTYSVPKASSERAKYNFTRQPEYIRLETPAGGDNFCGLMHIQEKVLSSTTRRKRPEATPNELEKTTTYLIHVETGSYLFSGTDAGVYISLYGTKGRSKKVLLDKLFHDDFERGSKEAYYITIPVIGDILFVKVFLIGGKFTLMRNWFLSNIVIFDLSTRKLFEIPCFRWISDKIILLTGKALTPQTETNLDRRHLRRLYMKEQQELVPWGHIDGFPGKIGYEKYDDLPIDLKFTTERQWQKKLFLTDVMLKLKIHQYVTVLKSFDSFEEFKAVADVVPSTETTRGITQKDNWRTDEEYGREFLNGVHPVMIRRCSAPIENFPVTDELVGGLLDRGMSLEEEMEAGHVYYINYNHFENIPRGGDENPRFLANPLVMFYVRASGELVPIAIQLEQTPSFENPIWTPNDSEIDWLLVKTWVKSADAHYQTMYSHLVRVHFIMEALSVALHRQLPVIHPVYKLLIQHTRFSIAAAQTGRDLLLFGEQSVLQKLMCIPNNLTDFIARRFKDFHINELIAPKDFASRGVDDKDKLPNYLYRDYAMLLWETVSEFVTKIMALYYKTDVDVIGDHELQAFVKDIHDHGLPSQTNVSNGVPEKLKNMSEMIEFLTMFIFHSSCFHSAMNYGQLDYYSFGPNYPSVMRKPPPTQKDVSDLQLLIETLPNKSDQATTLAFSSFLCERMSDEVFLGDTSDGYFTETAAREILEWFADELKVVSRAIHDRNNDFDIPYMYLIPELIPKSAGQ